MLDNIRGVATRLLNLPTHRARMDALREMIGPGSDNSAELHWRALLVTELRERGFYDSTGATS